MELGLHVEYVLESNFKSISNVELGLRVDFTL